MRTGPGYNEDHMESIDVGAVSVEIAGNNFQSTESLSGARGGRQRQNASSSGHSLDVGVGSMVVRGRGIEGRGG